MSAKVLAVHLSSSHSFSKQAAQSINLLPGIGVEGDAHSGSTVKHRSRVARDPSQPNLRQVHLVHSELLLELNAQGHPVVPGSIGENITTLGLDILALPQGTKLYVGAEAVVVITGLRNPCAQLDNFSPGLTSAVLDHTTDGKLIRKAGIMGIVDSGGVVRPGDTIFLVLPPGTPLPLKPV